MQIKKLYLKNFRNYKEQYVEFKDGLNVLYGQNAAGKTNMLEAIYISALAKSPRTTKEKELVLNGEKSAIVNVLVQKNLRTPDQGGMAIVGSRSGSADSDESAVS